ncbi:MAG: YhbY family RNA-binding protein [Butyrivibrio sp.]|nr:YhbY family RNA-binding protein [Butyrivibrio sp.]
MELSSKQRAYLRGLANPLEPVFQIGKTGVSPEVTASIAECFNTRELAKGTVLKNCPEEVREAAEKAAERTRSTLVCVTGRRIVLYKPFSEKPEIILPKG